MKKKEDIDRLITESLNEEEARFYESLEEGNVFRVWGSVYKGKFGWLAVIMGVVHVIALAITVYCGYWLFTVTDIAEIIRYGTILFIAWSFGAMIKLWHWLEINKNTTVREIKRLEFQVALLMEKISKE